MMQRVPNKPKQRRAQKGAELTKPANAATERPPSSSTEQPKSKPFYKQSSPPTKKTEEPLRITRFSVLKAASEHLVKNDGKDCAFKQSLEALLETIFQTPTTRQEGDRILVKKSQIFVLNIIESSPQILCTLAMCDPEVWKICDMLKNMCEEWKGMHNCPPNFYSLTCEFSNRCMKAKSKKDTTRTYWEDIPFHSYWSEDGFEINEEFIERIDFPNQVTFLAYRYFCASWWCTASGVPQEWTKREPWLLEWLKVCVQNCTKNLTIIQYQEKHNMNPRGPKTNQNSRGKPQRPRSDLISRPPEGRKKNVPPAFFFDMVSAPSTSKKPLTLKTHQEVQDAPKGEEEKNLPSTETATPAKGSWATIVTKGTPDTHE